MPRYIVSLHGSADLSDIRKDQPEAVGRSKRDHAVMNERIRNSLDHMNKIKIVQNNWSSNTIVVDVDNIKDLNAIRNRPEVKSVHREHTVRQHVHGPNPEESTWGLLTCNAPAVWDDFGITGSSVRVGVSDTGVDPNHVAFSGKDILWAEVDANGNEVDSTPHDSAAHGTHVSGTAVGQPVNEIDIGVAPDADLAHVLLLPGGVASESQILGGLDIATDMPIVALNMSWGTPDPDFYSNTYITVFVTMMAAGIVPVAASGNTEGSGEGDGSEPGNQYRTLSVGAQRSVGGINLFSRGRMIEKSFYSTPPSDWPTQWTTPRISAAGNRVLSAEAGTTDGLLEAAGTSMASPHVAGAVGLVAEANPNLTALEIMNVLIGTADWEDRYREEPIIDIRYGEGTLNVYKAVQVVS